MAAEKPGLYLLLEGTPSVKFGSGVYVDKAQLFPEAFFIIS